MSIKKSFVTMGANLIAAVAFSQSYSIDWHTIDDGGGTSTGGIYSLSGGISHGGAGAMSGGGFTLDGGFWSGIATPSLVETIFDNTNGSSAGFSFGNPSTMLANKFCLGSQSYSLDSVTLFLNTREPNIPPEVWLDIYSDDPATGRPVASTGVIMNLSGATNPIAFKLTASSYETPIKWVPATPFMLAANTCYWAVLTVESGEIMYAASFFMPTGAAAAYGRNQSQNGGVTWGPTDETTNRKMLIEGTALKVPQDGFRLGSLRISGNVLSFSFSTVAGRSYVIESRADLAAGDWAEVPGTTQTSAGASVEASLPIQAAKPRQFYRVKQLP